MRSILGYIDLRKIYLARTKSDVKYFVLGGYNYVLTDIKMLQFIFYFSWLL